MKKGIKTSPIRPSTLADINRLADLSSVSDKDRPEYIAIFLRLLDPHPKQIFIIGPNTQLGRKIVKLLESQSAPFTIKRFADNERIPHQLVTVTGQDVYIIFTAQKGVKMDKWKNDYLTFVRNIKWGRPYRITGVLPQLYHQRADVEDFKEREAKMSNLFPDLLKECGIDRIITCRLHNPASATDHPQMINIDTTGLIVKEILLKFKNDLSKLAIGAADMGGSKYARIVAGILGVPVIIADKQRDKRGGETTTMNVYDDGNISEEITIIVFIDDLIQTFKSLKGAGFAVSKKFPHIVTYIAVATHADFVISTIGNIADSVFESIWVTDTIPIDTRFVAKLKAINKSIKIITVAKWIARVIDNLHNNVPVSALWTNTNGN